MYGFDGEQHRFSGNKKLFFTLSGKLLESSAWKIMLNFPLLSVSKAPPMDQIHEKKKTPYHKSKETSSLHTF